MDESLFTITELALPGVLLIETHVWYDERGFTANTYSVEDFAEYGITTPFVQDVVSYSKKNVVRGLHFQYPPHAQHKLVRCSSGEIFDVVADHNPKSPAFGKHLSVSLKGDDQKSLYIPDSYAHGFCVVSGHAIVEYKLSKAYNPKSVGGVRFDDSVFSIDWPVNNPILSKQDTLWKLLS